MSPQPNPIKIEVRRREEEKETPRATICFYAMGVGRPKFSFVAGEQFLEWNGNTISPGGTGEIPAGTRIYPSVKIKNTSLDTGADCRIRVDTTSEENVFYAIEYIAKNGELDYKNAGYFVMPAHSISVIIRACHNDGTVDCIHAKTTTFTLNVAKEPKACFLAVDNYYDNVPSSLEIVVGDEVKVESGCMNCGGAEGNIHTTTYVDGALCADAFKSLPVGTANDIARDPDTYSVKASCATFDMPNRAVKVDRYGEHWDGSKWVEDFHISFMLTQKGVAPPPPPGEAKAVILSKSPTTDRNFTIGDTVDVELELINWGKGRGEIKGIVKKDGAIFTSCEGSVDIGDKISTTKSFIMPATTVALDFFTYHKYPAGWPVEYDEYESVLLTPVAKGVPKWGLVGDPVWKDDDVWFDFLMLNPRIDECGTGCSGYRYTYRGYLDLDGKPAVRGTFMDYDNHTGKVSVPKSLLDSLGYTATIKLRVKDRETGTETWIDEVTKIIPAQPAGFNVKFAVDGDTVEVHPYILVIPGETNPVAATIKNNGDTPVSVDMWARFGNTDIPPQTTPSIPPHSEITFNYNFITPSVSPGSYPCTFYIGEHGGDIADEYTQPVIRVSGTIIEASYDFSGVIPPPKQMVAGETYQITLPITVNDILGVGSISADVWTVKDKEGLTSAIVGNNITIVDDRVFPLMESRRIGMSKTPLLVAGSSHRIIHEFTVPTDLPLGPHTFATYFGEWGNYFLLNGMFSGYTFDAEIVTEVKPASFEVTVPAGVPPCTVSCNRVYKVPLLPLYITDPLWSPLHESCLSPPCSFSFSLDGKYIGDKFGIAALSAGTTIFTFPESEVYTLSVGATSVTVSGLHASLSIVDVLMPTLGISVENFMVALKLAVDFITETEWRELGRRVFNKSIEDFIMVLGTLWEWMPTKAMSDILILLIEGVGVYTVRDAIFDSFLHHSPIAFVAAAAVVLTAIMAIVGVQIVLSWACEEWLQGLGLAVWAAIDVGNWELARLANKTFYKGIWIYCIGIGAAMGLSISASLGVVAEVEVAIHIAQLYAIAIPLGIGAYFLVLAWAVKQQHNIYTFVITDHLPVPYKPPMKGEITGAIKLTTEPAGASIYIKQEGVWEPTYMTSPQTLVLPVGTHDFMFYLLDWKNIEWEGEVTYSLSKHRKLDETIILKEIGTGLPKEPTLITNARVIKVVDGDTIHVTSPDVIYPPETPGYLKVRILGMNTPDIKRHGTTILGYYARRMATVGGVDDRWDIEKEIYTKSAKEAIDRLDGKTVTLRSDIDNQWGTHDRFLATVEIGGADYGAEMLSLGHAAVFFYSPNAIFDAAKRDEYINLYEKPAKDAEIGIWAPPPIVEPDTGKISCKSSPSTAEIWLDGKDTEYKTPKTLDKIAVGEHTVTFKAPLKCTKTLEQCRLLECSDTVTVEDGKTKPADCNLCAIYEIHQPYYCKGRRCAEEIRKETFSPYIRIDGKETDIRTGDHTIIKFGTDIDGNVYRFGKSFGGCECGFGTHTIELWLGGWKTMKATEKIDPGDYFEIKPEIPEGDPGEEVEPIKPVPPVVEMTGTLHIGHAFDADTGIQLSTGANKFPLHVLIGGVTCDCRCYIDEDLVFGDDQFCNRKDKLCPLPLGTHTFIIERKNYENFEFTVTVNAGDEIDAPKINMVFSPDAGGAAVMEESVIPEEMYLERDAIFEIKVLNTSSIPAKYSTRMAFEGTDNTNVFPFESEISDAIAPGEKVSLPVPVRLPERAIPQDKTEAEYEISLVVVAYI